MRPNVAGAIIVKQFQDVVKNIQVLVLFIIYPVIAVALTGAVGREMSAYFVSVFATMHCVFTPLVCTSAVIAEEKEKNTLRVLIMSNVTSLEYLVSIGAFVFLATMLTGVSFVFIGGYTGVRVIQLLLAMAVGCIISIIIGMCTGASAKNMTAANGLAVPIGMAFSFVPMVASFNKGIENVSFVLFSQQVSYLVGGTKDFGATAAIVIAINFILFVTLFFFLFRRNRLDS